MKCVAKSRSTNARFKEVLQRELRALTELPKSPFLMRCHLAFESPSTVFFLTDLIGGGDLFYHLDVLTQQGKLGFPEHQARVLIAETAAGLCHMHDVDIIHRDIKVENIILTSDGHVKLVDYRLCFEVKTEEGVKIKPVGSLIYMAPELLRESMAGRYTDWWALGVLGHELLTGTSPWSTLMNTKQIKKEIMSSNMKPPLQGMSAAAAELISALMSSDRTLRLGYTESREVLRHHFFTEALDMAALERGQAPHTSILDNKGGGAERVGLDEELEADREEALTRYCEMSTMPPTTDWTLDLKQVKQHPRSPQPIQRR